MPRIKKEPRLMICTRHDYIMDICEASLKIFKGNAKLTSEDKKILKEQIREVINHTKLAKLSGQAMEERLRKYRYAVEDLGFERIEPKKRLG
jgi:hypothetical protein